MQTVVPLLAFLAWSRWRLPRVRLEGAEVAALRRFVRPLLVGLVVFAIVGFAWYGFVLWNIPGVLAEWRAEVTREGATDMEPSRWYNYVLRAKPRPGHRFGDQPACAIYFAAGAEEYFKSSR